MQYRYLIRGNFFFSGKRKKTFQPYICRAYFRTDFLLSFLALFFFIKHLFFQFVFLIQRGFIQNIFLMEIIHCLNYTLGHILHNESFPYLPNGTDILPQLLRFSIHHTHQIFRSYIPYRIMQFLQFIQNFLSIVTFTIIANNRMIGRQFHTQIFSSHQCYVSNKFQPLVTTYHFILQSTFLMSA